MRLRAFTLLSAALALSACQRTTDRTEADIAAIPGLVEAYDAALEVSDVSGLVDLRADDVVQLPPDAPISRGKRPLEDFYRGLFEQFSIWNRNTPPPRRG